ncbi:hypothetical protein QYF61_020550 [Mycteria americana]|uniref:Uncharacterized protein n=1 Tax=Mycteria americana TaxID=33587 RepID=A0AAN7NU74_MYCAM|nr:hypothetical protein QYF61_020550 [Mycteria americana]
MRDLVWSNPLCSWQASSYLDLTYSYFMAEERAELYMKHQVKKEPLMLKALDLTQAMKYELYLTKLKRGYDFNWDYSDKTGSTTLAHSPGDPGTGGEIISGLAAQLSHSLLRGRGEGWRLNHFPGQPVPVLDNPFSEEKFPNIQSKPPLAQLEAISSCPITCYLGEETDPHLTTTSFQRAIRSPLSLLFSRLNNPSSLSRSSQDFCSRPFTSFVALLWTRSSTSMSLFAEYRGTITYFPSPAGHAIFNTSQDAIGFLGHLGTLLAHIQAAVNQHPQVLLCQAAFQPLFSKPVALHGVAVAQVQDLALGLVEPHTIDLGPSIQPVQVPLQSLPTLQQINTPTQLGVICKLTEGALDPFIQIIDKDMKQKWPQHRAPGNTTCDRLPTGFNSIHHHSLGPAIQPVLYPAKSTPVQAMSSQFLQENAVGNRVKGFTEV